MWLGDASPVLPPELPCRFELCTWAGRRTRSHLLDRYFYPPRLLGALVAFPHVEGTSLPLTARAVSAAQSTNTPIDDALDRSCCSLPFRPPDGVTLVATRRATPQARSCASDKAVPSADHLPISLTPPGWSARRVSSRRCERDEARGSRTSMSSSTGLIRGRGAEVEQHRAMKCVAAKLTPRCPNQDR
jgi:hypothetical protein